MHVLLPADRGRPADGVFGDLRRPAALPGPAALRRRQGTRGGVHRERAGPVPGAAGPAAGPVRPGRRGGGAGERDHRRVAGGGPEIAGLRADQAIPGGAPAAPGIPHHADGLVRAAAVPGGGRDQPGGARRRGRAQPVRRDLRVAHPGRVPGRPVHRRRHRTRGAGAAHAGRDAVLHARHQPGPGRRPVHPGVGRHDAGDRLRDVPVARGRQIRSPVRDPDRLRGAGTQAGGVGDRLRARLRGRPGHVRVRPVRRGQRRTGAGRRGDLPGAA